MGNYLCVKIYSALIYTVGIPAVLRFGSRVNLPGVITYLTFGEKLNKGINYSLIFEQNHIDFFTINVANSGIYGNNLLNSIFVMHCWWCKSIVLYKIITP